MLTKGLALKPELTAARLRELLHYDPETGAFTWLLDNGRRRAGERAERKAAKGYRGITIDGSPYLCHRLAWLYTHGRWPVGDVDHKDGVRSNNAATNLREGSRGFNMQNLRRAHCDSISGVLGAAFDRRRQRWMSSIYVKGRNKFLGYFNSPEEAGRAYIEAKRRLHDGCTI